MEAATCVMEAAERVMQAADSASWKPPSASCKPPMRVMEAAAGGASIDILIDKTNTLRDSGGRGLTPRRLIPPKPKS